MYKGLIARWIPEPNHTKDQVSSKKVKVYSKQIKSMKNMIGCCAALPAFYQTQACGRRDVLGDPDVRSLMGDHPLWLDIKGTRVFRSVITGSKRSHVYITLEIIH